MGSISLWDIMRAVNAEDYGSRGNYNQDDGAAINRAILDASRLSPASGEGGSQSTGGIVFIPPGLYRIQTPIDLLSNVTVFGFGSQTILKAHTNGVEAIIRGKDVSNVRVRDLRIDGNRALNTKAVIGVKLTNVQASWFNNVEVVSCQSDGIQLNGCDPVELEGCRSSDNGRHGISLNGCSFCQIIAPKCYDNAQAGTGDGINLDILSHDNLILAPLCYEGSLAGVLQEYGAREQSGGGCYRNVTIGGMFRGNKTGEFLAEPDSMTLSYINMLTGGLSIGTGAVDAAAILDIQSNTQGVHLPVLTTAQKTAVVSPPSGLVVYDSGLGKLAVFTGTNWEAVTSAP